jgi:hypothetical protein
MHDTTSFNPTSHEQAGDDHPLYDYSGKYNVSHRTLLAEHAQTLLLCLHMQIGGPQNLLQQPSKPTLLGPALLQS